MSKNEKENIKIKPKHLFCDINLISMLSFLGANNRLPLFHMTKSLVYIQEIDQHINQFSIGYMINPRLNTNGIFKDQVNICMMKTFNVTEQKHITKILTQENTIVLALLWFYESNTKESKKLFRVLSSVIYTILGNYVCIDYLACLPKLLSTYPLNAGGGFKHEKKPTTIYRV